MEKVFNSKIIDTLQDVGIDLGKKLIVSILILVIGNYIIKLILKALKKEKILNKRLDPGLQTFIMSFVKVLLYIVLYMTIASVLGIPLTTLVTVLGSCGVAVGLALQGGLSNIAGGILILFFKPFRVGDWVDTGTYAGTVSAINLFYTILVTPDNRTIFLPNGSLSNNPCVNFSKEKYRRLDIDFTASYDNDQETVKKVLNDIVNKEKTVIIDDDTKKPFVKLTNFGDSSITYTVRVWLKAEDYWDTKFNIMSKVKEEFTKNNISIPYPQLDVHLEK